MVLIRRVLLFLITVLTALAIVFCNSDTVPMVTLGCTKPFPFNLSLSFSFLVLFCFFLFFVFLEGVVFIERWRERGE